MDLDEKKYHLRLPLSFNNLCNAILSIHAVPDIEINLLFMINHSAVTNAV